MKFDNFSNVDEENISGEISSTEAGINEENLGIIFDMMSTQMYKNPIGSIVREITSNCFDSHIEAGVNDAVVIVIDKDDEGLYISFSDVGVGLSPDRVKNVYMKYFSSTKRDSNEMIGGFGLGSKSPLAYADFFYITTRFNGIEYLYILSKGSKKPTLDLLSESSTDKRNGTEIKIYIKDEDDNFNSNADVVKFTSELQKQLLYFDNVYIDIRAYGTVWTNKHDLNNEYKIYEFENFKFRSSVYGTGTGDLRKGMVTNTMHICYGKVNYPIDWAEIGIPNRINTPIGIKFEIGELMVTPNRESLRYTDDVKNKIIRKIKLASEELVSEYYGQNKDIYDLKEYFLKMNEKPHISFKRDDNDENSLVDKLYVKDIKGIKPSYVFKPLDDIGCTAVGGIVNEEEWYINDCISKGKKSRGSNRKKISELIIDNIKGLFITGNATSYYKNRYIMKCDFIRRSILTPRQIYCKYLGLVGSERMSGGFGSGEHFEVGTAKKIYLYRKIVEAEMNKMFGTYEDIVVPREFIQEIAPKRASTADLRKTQKMIRVYEFNNEGWIDCKPVDLMKHTINRNNKPSGLLIYGFREDKDKLQKAQILLLQKRNLRRDYSEIEKNKHDYKVLLMSHLVNKKIRFDQMNDLHYTKAIKLKDNIEFLKKKMFSDPSTLSYLNTLSARVIMIAKKDEKYFETSSKMTHVDNLFSDNKIFREIATASLIEDFDFVPNYHAYSGHLSFRSQIVPRMANINRRISEVIKYLESYVKVRTFREASTGKYKAKEVREEILNIARKGNLFDQDILKLVEEVKNYFEGADMLKFIEIDLDNEGYIAKYLKDKGKSINYDFYVKGIYNYDGKLIEKPIEEIEPTIDEEIIEKPIENFFITSLVPKNYYSYNCLNKIA